MVDSQRQFGELDSAFWGRTDGSPSARFTAMVACPFGSMIVVKFRDDYFVAHAA
jgi:hypothetical protein